MIRRFALATTILLLVAAFVLAQGDSAVRVEQIGRRVADYPKNDNFSSPADAYASLHHHFADGDDDLRTLSVARVAARLPKPTSRAVSAKAAEGYLNARIVECHHISDRLACVLAQWPASGSFDVRTFEQSAGRWLNVSDTQADTLADARHAVEVVVDQRRAAQLYRRDSTEPREYLDPFVKFLQQSADTPKHFLLDAVRHKRLIVVGQLSARPAYSKLIADVLCDDSAPALTLYLDLPANQQGRIDRGISGNETAVPLLLEALRDAAPLGQPDSSLLQLLQSIQSTNLNRSVDRKIRIVAAGAPLRWSTIQTADDLAAQTQNADAELARRVQEDLDHDLQAPRHSLLLLDFRRAARSEGSKAKTAGRILSDALPDQSLLVMEHLPQLALNDHATGRTARGLFDSAFHALGDRPLALSLSQNAFGGEPFDSDATQNVTATFQQVFDAYIVMERLEDEWQSPVIEKFFTDDLINEFDRRSRIQSGLGLIERFGLTTLDAASLTQALCRSSGQSRNWRDSLGPIDAWQRRDDTPMP